MQFEHLRASTESARSGIELPHHHYDIKDLKIQPLLITRFFEKQHPDMPLDDPDTRELAAQWWVGDVESPHSLAAHFRRYVDNAKGSARIVDTDDSQSLDAILDALA